MIVFRSRIVGFKRKVGSLSLNQAKNGFPAGDLCSCSASRRSTYALSHGAYARQPG